jgi:outer membrane protein
MLIDKVVSVSVLAIALGCGVAQAQKIAIIDMQGAVLNTTDGKKAAAQIDAKFAPKKAELDQLQKDILAKQDQFTKTRGTMNATALAAAQSELESLSTSLKRKQEDAQQDLQEEENKVLGGIMPKLQQVINAYAAANQITVVVDSSANPNNLIYADASVNITPAVLTAYEKAAAERAPTPKTAAPSVTTPKPPAATTTRPPASSTAPPRTAAPGK